MPVIAGMLRPEPDDDPLLTAVVEAVNPDGTTDVSYRGALAFGVEGLQAYAPAVGDVVQVVRRGRGKLYVLGTTRVFNPPTVRLVSDLEIVANVQGPPPAPDTADNPGGLANPYLVRATTTASFRGRSWRTDNDDVYQGAYGRSNFGYHTGCFFFGTKPQALRGRRITGARIWLRRSGGGGESAAQPLWLYPHIHPSRPAGAPVLRSGATSGVRAEDGTVIGNPAAYYVRGPLRVGALAWGREGWFGLPVSWAQSLVDGTIKGFAVFHASTADYVILPGRSDVPANGQLELSWQ